MNYEETLAYIHSLKRFGVTPGLQRIRRLMAALGDPQQGMKFVHVAGTNGKGSTSTMISMILRKAGYKTGLYISPFILDFRERMQINGEMIPQEELCALAQCVKSVSEKLEGEAPNEFEVITAMALLWFREKNCDVVVLEVGLGGRYDATNVIPAPLVSVLTTIDLDHTQILGDTVEQIAAEKCGIIKPGSQVVCCPDQNEDALAVIMEHCAMAGCTLHQGNLAHVQVQECSLGGSRIIMGEKSLFIPLVGRHQIANCVTVLTAAQALARSGLSIPWQAVEQGIADTRFPARLEVLSREPLVILDGAHNPSGARALADALQLLQGQPVTAVCGMMADKNWHQAVGIVAPHCSRLVAVKPDNPRSLEAQILAQEADLYCPAFIAESPEEAWRKALSFGDPVVIWGSLYLASDMRTLVLRDLAKKI